MLPLILTYTWQAYSSGPITQSRTCSEHSALITVATLYHSETTIVLLFYNEMRNKLCVKIKIVFVLML